MPEEEKKQTTEKKREEKRPMQRLLEALGLSEEIGEPKPSGQIIAPVNIDRLIESLLEMPTGEEEEEATKHIPVKVSKTLTAVHAITRKFTDMYIRDGLGRIQHPIYGVPIVESRLGILAQMLSNVIREIWEDIAYQFRSGKMSPQEFSEYVHEAETATKYAFAILVQVYENLLQIFYVNGPPELRPPLVNASLGYELLGGTRLLKRTK